MAVGRAFRQSQEVRTATLGLLKASEGVLSMAQRVNERAITRMRLRVRGWRLALDPSTRGWINETRGAFSAGTLEQDAVDGAEASRRLDQARRGLSA